MPLIYLVRHGQTDWNADDRLQGQIDTPINAKGRSQAKRNGETLARLIGALEGFDFAASPLGRTRETMEILRAELGLDPENYRTDDRLKEIHFGDWQGGTWDELREQRPDEIAARFDDPWNTVAPGAGGESFAMLSARVLSWFKLVKQDTIVATHGGVIRCVMGHIEQTPKQQIPHFDIPQDRIYVAGETSVEQI